jgi:hypothetical protein
LQGIAGTGTSIHNPHRLLSPTEINQSENVKKRM